MDCDNFMIPTLTGINVQLRPTSQHDYPLLFKWASNTSVLYLWMEERKIQTFEQFEDVISAKLRNRIHMIIEKKDEGLPLGAIFAYNLDYIDRHVFFTVYLDKAYLLSGFGEEAILLFLDYLFTYHPFRKIYAEIPSFNKISVNKAKKLGFVKEGCFKKHLWFNDNYWDVYFFALYRDNWLDKYKNRK